MISGTTKASPVQLCTVIVLCKTCRIHMETRRTRTCDITKRRENSDLREARQIIHQSKVLMRAFQKLNFIKIALLN